MFTDIKEGLQVYKDELRGYLKKCREIAEIVKRSRQRRGEVYSGFIDWPTKEYEWVKRTRNKLEGMEIALGLSKEEQESITKEIESLL